MLTKIEGEKGVKIWIETPDFLPFSKYRPKSQDEFITDRSCFGCSDAELEDIKKKPFIVTVDLKVLIEFNSESYEFTIPKGYTFNGANVPSFAWLLIGQQFDPRFKMAACCHDFVCERHSAIGNNRYLSTLMFVTLCEYFGRFNKYKRWAMKHSVDNFQKLFGKDEEGNRW